MNKQQLAAKIWESANQMRSKIEANEYKDYILGFIFYKYLSDKELQFCKKEGMSDDEIRALSEDDNDAVEYIQKELGFFIAYENLFSSWLEAGSDFDVANVRDALSAFDRLIHKNHKKLFDGIFDTLQTGLSKLGENAAKQTKSVSNLLQLIKDIPMDGKQGYDVLGYIYEYLIEKFAANAGKKAGEFYTPHEVSLLMSEIVAHHLKDKTEIEIYDPTSGSGSLLINIGHSVAKHMDNADNIKYYAQELKEPTYNLTRMNLVMRGILPNNIQTRNGDTLEDDWPYFDENDLLGSYNPLYVDAVVSNPPYSQKWDPEHKESDPRYSRFGMAPKTKADYAFLLHDLYHIKPDGIMTIVLPHGVLFRGGEEGVIRKRLIEQNHIDAIIGLPANIFFGTGIPTVILVLRQKRSNTDVLVVDASKHFTKVGKNNKLQASDIKRMVDTVTQRVSTPKYAKVVSRESLRANDYNLNIPRYVDSAADAQSWDLHATMLGGMPQKEIKQLDAYWQAFPALHEALFEDTSGDYTELKISADGLKQAITEHKQVQAFNQNFTAAFSDFDNYLKAELINKIATLNIPQQKVTLSKALFERLQNIVLIDKYHAYQLLDDSWQTIVTDLEMLQTEGLAVSKQVDPHLVIKKKNGKDIEVQEGWVGHIMPFELVQTTYLSQALDALQQKENRLAEIKAAFEEIIDSFSEEEKDSAILNNDNTAFAKTEVSKEIKELYSEVKTDEIMELYKYLELLDKKAKKPEKIAFIEGCDQVEWGEISANKDGTYGKANINKYIQTLQSVFKYPEGTYESKIVLAHSLLGEEKALKDAVKADSEALHLQTKTTIEGLSDAQVNALLERKWISPLLAALSKMPDVVINRLTSKLHTLAEKYATTYGDVEKAIASTEKELSALIDQLTGNEADMQGLAELKAFLNAE